MASAPVASPPRPASIASAPVAVPARPAMEPAAPVLAPRREPAAAASAPTRPRREPVRTESPVEARPSPGYAPTYPSSRGARCSDILQKASLEPLTAEEAAYLKRECR
jgi:hypothetical protein